MQVGWEKYLTHRVVTRGLCEEGTLKRDSTEVRVTGSIGDSKKALPGRQAWHLEEKQDSQCGQSRASKQRNGRKLMSALEVPDTESLQGP